MGLDVGDKRIGVAISDPLGILSTAFTTIERKNNESEFARILSIIKDHQIGRIIVGLPRLLDGGLGTQAEKTQDFVDKLARLTEVPIEMFDERLSTDLAGDLLREAGRNYKEIRRKKDEAAAALILQWYLDEKSGTPKTEE